MPLISRVDSSAGFGLPFKHGDWGTSGLITAARPSRKSSPERSIFSLFRSSIGSRIVVQGAGQGPIGNPIRWLPPSWYGVVRRRKIWFPNSRPVLQCHFHLHGFPLLIEVDGVSVQYILVPVEVFDEGGNPALRSERSVPLRPRRSSTRQIRRPLFKKDSSRSRWGKGGARLKLRSEKIYGVGRKVNPGSVDRVLQSPSVRL